jgi:hypothetical protein
MGKEKGRQLVFVSHSGEDTSLTMLLTNSCRCLSPVINTYVHNHRREPVRKLPNLPRLRKSGFGSIVLRWPLVLGYDKHGEQGHRDERAFASLEAIAHAQSLC